MLEARKLSAQVHQELGGRAWSVSFLVLWLFAVAVLASLWIGANFEAPAPDKTQEKLNEAHAKALEVVATLTSSLNNDQELNADLFEQLSSVQAPLFEFGQQAASGLQLAPDTKDTQTWPGKINVMLDDLKFLNESKESVLSYFRLRDALLGLYRPKGPVNPKQLAEGTPARGFYTAVIEWRQAGLPPDAATNAATNAASTLTWSVLAKSQAPWRDINSQMDALELDAKQAEDAGRAKVAKEWVALLSKNDLMQSVRNADDAWARVNQAHERLVAAVNQLPPAPKAIVAAPPFHGSQLAFPGTTSQGLMASAALMVLGLLTAVIGHSTRRSQIEKWSKQWLTVTQQLEASIRSVDAPLTQAIARIEALSNEFAVVTDKLKSMQQAITSPAEAPPKSMEEQAWSAATRMQAELESDLNLLREKLLNIHLQFCSGQTHENLVYDLAFTTEAVQTVFVTARDLGRSVALLKDSLQQTDAQGDGQDIEQLMTQVNNLKAAAKRIAVGLQDLSGRLQVAVDDVPEGRRFETAVSADDNGGLRVNQPI
jgi:hypothetical protein